MSGTVAGLDLDRLEELAKQATPGPWVWDVTPDRCWAQIHSASAHGGVGEFVGNIPDDDLADFIAEFRNAVPSLLAAARAVQRVRALHVPYDCTAAGEEGHETCGEREWCYSCPEELGWPCPTVVALDGE